MIFWCRSSDPIFFLFVVVIMSGFRLADHSWVALPSVESSNHAWCVRGRDSIADSVSLIYIASVVRYIQFVIMMNGYTPRSLSVVMTTNAAVSSKSNDA